MKGFPILIFIVIAISIGIRILKAVAEAQQSQGGDEWEGSDAEGGEWTDWKAARKESSPPPRPRRAPAQAGEQPVLRRRPAPAQQADGSRRLTAKEKLREILREAQQAASQPRTAPVVPGPVAAPPPPPQPAQAPDVSEPPSQSLPAMASFGEPAERRELVSTHEVAAQSLGPAFPSAGGDPWGTRSAGRVRIRVGGRKGLRRAIVLRELLERPRAFDM